MYLELDGDEIAVTYIKDVTFNANRKDVEVMRMTKVLLGQLSVNSFTSTLPLLSFFFLLLNNIGAVI